MPIRYMRAEIQTQKMAVAINRTIDKTICHAGGPNASLAGITMGEKSGKIEDQTAKVLFGTRRAANIIYKAMITGIVNGIVKA